MNWEIKYLNEFFSKKTDIHNQQPFFVYKINSQELANPFNQFRQKFFLSIIRPGTTFANITVSPCHICLRHSPIFLLSYLNIQLYGDFIQYEYNKLLARMICPFYRLNILSRSVFLGHSQNIFSIQLMNNWPLPSYLHAQPRFTPKA